MHHHPACPPTLKRPGDQLDLEIDDSLTEAHRVRHIAEIALAEVCPPERMVDVRIVISELVTNALLHGTEPRRLVMRLTPAGLYIEVDDGSSAIPDFTDPPPDIGGLGLHLIDRLSREWGTTVHRGGKGVWSRMELDQHADVA